MVPTLKPGEELVVTGTRPPAVGNVVVLPHPQRQDFWLVKRLAAAAGDTVITDKGTLALGEAQGWVLSDNERARGAHDSRTFGVIDLATARPMVTELDEPTFVEALDLLVEEDESLAAARERHGTPPFWKRPRGFQTLVLLILEQQVSLESGAAVYRRLRELVGPVTPETVAGVTPEVLNGIGFTRQKAGYVVDLARHVSSGDLDLDGLRSLNSGEAAATLQEIRGIGRWTAEAYLLAAEGRPDVFPIGDRALQVGAGEVLGMESPPRPEELELLAGPWRPIRAAAARLIWHAYLSKRGRVEPGHRTVHEPRPSA